MQLILKNLGEIDKVWIPYSTCSIVEKAIQNIGIRVVKYSVNYELEIAEDIKLGTHDYLIYTNYFGIMDSYVHLLASQYGFKLIIDNAQAFYVDSIEECHQLYSPRKFVGVGDGGIAVSSHLLSTEHLPLAKSEFHSTHLLMRAEGDIATGYTFFKESEEILGDSSLQLMSLITRRNLHSLDYEKIKHVMACDCHIAIPDAGVLKMPRPRSQGGGARSLVDIDLQADGRDGQGGDIAAAVIEGIRHRRISRYAAAGIHTG